MVESLLYSKEYILGCFSNVIKVNFNTDHHLIYYEMTCEFIIDILFCLNIDINQFLKGFVF